MNQTHPERPESGTARLPPLSGKLLVGYRILWWALLASALAATAWASFNPGTYPLILALRMAKSAVLIAVAVILYRRRTQDAVAAMLGMSFLLWTISSSTDFSQSSFIWPALVDRLRFLLFALALLLFPDGEWYPRWTRQLAGGIVCTFLLGAAEASGLIATRFYLPLAIACVILALTALFASYRRRASVRQQQQVKWAALGLVVGISLILSARTGVALAPHASMVSMLAFEALFQIGIVVIALGFLTALLRYRLYDAEAAISRSAAFAALTLALVGTFAASESVIQSLGQRFFGAGIGELSGGIAAAIAAVLLTPLHGRISSWAERRFQHDLVLLKQELPPLLVALSAGASARQLAADVLPRIGSAIQSERIALIVDRRLVAAWGLEDAGARRFLRRWKPPPAGEQIGLIDDDCFSLFVALRCSLDRRRGWLLLGPRPDASHHGKDEIEALCAIAPMLQRTLFAVVERETARAADRRFRNELDQSMRSLEERLTRVENRHSPA